MWWNKIAVNNRPLTLSDLPIFNGRIYHTQLRPEDLAPNMIIVGDPERVPAIADDFLRVLM